MKRLAVAAAMALASTAGFAQSTVTVFGVLDVKVAVGRGSIAGTFYSLGSGGIAGNRLGFRGREDLGGGMSASFWLEAQFDPGTGTGLSSNTNNQPSGATPIGGLVFNRRSTVSLAGKWGEVRLGRDYTPQFWNVNLMDPFQTNGIGGNTMLLYGQGSSVSARASNSIAYHSPSFAGVTAQVMTWRGENNPVGAPTDHDGNGLGARVAYKRAEVDGSVAVAKTRYATGDVTTSNIGIGVNLGPVRLTSVYGQDKVSRLGTGKGFLAAATYEVGPGEFRMSYSAYKRSTAGRPESRKLALGYVHDLSKRTALYGTVARVDNKGSANLGLNDAANGPGRKASGIDLGIRHLF